MKDCLPTAAQMTNNALIDLEEKIDPGDKDMYQ